MSRILAILPTVNIELEVDGELKRYRTPLVFIGVGERELKLPHLGDRIKNGKRGLHIFVVRSRKRARLLVIAFEAVARGVKTVRREPELDAYLVNGCVAANLRHPMATIAFDGETATMETPLSYRIERDALRIVIPETVDEAEVKAAEAHPTS
jgi:diacylglycerol kinase family enzyme